MINRDLLRAKMLEKHISAEDMAKVLGIDRATFYRKVRNDSFTIRQADTIKQTLSLSLKDANAIFFASQGA